MKMLGRNIAVQLIEETVINKTQSGIILPDLQSNKEYRLAHVVIPDKNKEFKEGDKVAIELHSGIEYKDMLIIKVDNILFID